MAEEQEREDRAKLVKDLAIKFYEGTWRAPLAKRAKGGYDTAARRAFSWLFENYNVTIEPKADPDTTVVKGLLADLAEPDAMADFDIYLKVYKKGKEDAVSSS